ncbi:MAG: formylglycine-generating enzyme family protein [Methylococcales symbiont of Hymedesmia sp. n. MRB-2018]|nr:MAG: formylglycine-generating enzyme family protein [Methylococcales symbiont of Hymedesmia sp. n. MRB-2018]
MLNKILFSVIVLSVLTVVLLLSPWHKNIPSQTLKIKASDQQKSALDKILLENLNVIKARHSLIKSLTQPPKTVVIKKLWVDKTEVAQADFYKFVGWTRAHNSSAFFAPTQPQDWKFYSSSKTHGLSGKLGVSANGISFYDAYAYCRANGARLPSADEFRAIAESRPAQLYPWGNKFNPKPWPYFDARLNATLKPAIFPSSDTKEGVADLGALLSEWTLGNYPQGYPFIQGGNAYSSPHEIYALTMVYRSVPAKSRSPYVGFRCVYDTKPRALSPWKSKINSVLITNKTIKTNHYPHSTIRPFLHYLSRLNVDTFKSLLPIQRKSDYQLSVGINEASVAQYAQFMADIFVSFGLYSHPQKPQNHSLQPLNWQQQKDHPNRPVVGVDWWSAYHFANWAGGRLPTYKESIKMQVLAAVQKSVFADHRQTYPAELKPNTKISHLLGNVSEWTSSIDSSKENLSMIVRGGSFLIHQKRANNIDFYRSISPHYRAQDIGLRVVFDKIK